MFFFLLFFPWSDFLFLEIIKKIILYVIDHKKLWYQMTLYLITPRTYTIIVLVYKTCVIATSLNLLEVETSKFANVFSTFRDSFIIFIPKCSKHPFSIYYPCRFWAFWAFNKNTYNFTIHRWDIGPFGMEVSTLFDQYDKRVKGQGHLTVFVFMNLISIMFKVVYKTYLMAVIELNKEF